MTTVLEAEPVHDPERVAKLDALLAKVREDALASDSFFARHVPPSARCGVGRLILWYEPAREEEDDRE